MEIRRFSSFRAVLAGALSLAVLPACGGGEPSKARGHDAGGGADGAAESVLLRVTVKNVSTDRTATTSTGAPLPVVFGPGVYAVHAAGLDWFEPGAAATPDLEHLAEDGDPKDAAAALQARGGFVAGLFGADELNVSYDDSPITAGVTADFTVSAAPGDRLDLGMMWSQSNDVFVATEPGGIPLFDGAAPRAGLVSDGLSLWDAGTEVNQEPGLGDAQGPRQPGPGFGTKEDGVIARIENGKDASGYTYPPLTGTLEVTISRQ